MRYFFIDLENVRNEGLEGVLSLNEKDMVYIFYSENAFSMAIPTMESITNSRCSSKFIKTNYIGKNAMDFQIVSLFGAMIERCREGSFYIISKDNGFRSAVSFCESFFSEYPIKCGVYPRIITAIAAESKNSGKENTPKVNTVTDKVAEATEAAKDKKSRRRSRKRSGKHEQNENPSVAEVSLPEDNTANEIAADVPAAGSEAPVEEKTGKSRRRRSRNKKEKNGNTGENPVISENTQESAAQPAADTAEDKTSKERDKEETENTAHGKLEYIYRLLGEYLSEKTIEIYAGYIDEGIARTANRDELQVYFRENLGDDEGEALFKVVRSDYEKFKQSRPKRTSRTRHRRSGKTVKNIEKEAE